MRNGAFDYLEKRLDADTIVTRVLEAIEGWRQLHERHQSSPAISSAIRNYYQLTRREREVLAQIAAAASNKETARNLGISPRTVEIHRGRIMHKLGAKNSVDLMRIVMNPGTTAATAKPKPKRRGCPQPSAFDQLPDRAESERVIGEPNPQAYER